MFRQCIYETPLNTSSADIVLGNITGDTFNGDVSFIATARALIAPRMDKSDYLEIEMGATVYSGITAKNQPEDAVLAVSKTSKNCIYIHSFNNSNPDDNDKWMDHIDENLVKYRKGFVKLDKVTLFFRKVFRVICFVNPSTKTVLIYTSLLNYQRFHYLQCGILAFLPWYFNKEDGISDLEMELIESLRMKSSSKYERCIERIASQYDFRTIKIKNMLEGFETRFEKNELEVSKTRYENIMCQIRDIKNNLNDVLKRKALEEAKILGLEIKIKSNNGESEVCDYFMSNKRLYIQNISDDRLVFSVKDYVTYWDEDMAESMIDNRHSYVYEYLRGTKFSPDDIKDLLTAIFVDEVIKLKFCASYTIYFSGGVTGISSYSFGPEFNDATPNPHINRYSCLGNYEKTINEVMEHRDYINAIEQCVASCKSLNFGDSVVMEYFMQQLLGKTSGENIRCLELPNGEVVKPIEALEYLRKEHNEKEECHEQVN